MGLGLCCPGAALFTMVVVPGASILHPLPECRFARELCEQSSMKGCCQHRNGGKLQETLSFIKENPLFLQIGSLENYYHFHHSKTFKRSTLSSRGPHNFLRMDPKVWGRAAWAPPASVGWGSLLPIVLVWVKGEPQHLVMTFCWSCRPVRAWGDSLDMGTSIGDDKHLQ